MKRKEILEKKLERLNAKKAKLSERCDKATDVTEVRNLTAELEELNAEVEECRAEISAIDEEVVPATAEHRGLNVATFETRENGDIYAGTEYRNAFMAYAQKGTAIPAKFAKRDDSAADTESLGAIIPTTVLNEFIKELGGKYGQLYAKVRKMNIKGAVKIPIAKLSAEVKWISEGETSDRQNGGNIKDYVEFSYNMAEIRVAQTLLSQIVSLDVFEREVVRLMTEAFLKAMDNGIINGTGNGQMLGILNDARVAAQGQTVELTAADMGDWTAWKKKFFKVLPLAYRTGEFIFPVSTVDSYLETMADNNNNPVFREATGLDVDDANTSGRFFGRNITLVEPDIIPDFDSAAAGDVIGVYWQPEQYAINSNMQFGVRRWFDEDRNEWVNKMLVVVDGKVLDAKGFVLIKKKA